MHNAHCLYLHFNFRCIYTIIVIEGCSSNEAQNFEKVYSNADLF